MSFRLSSRRICLGATILVLSGPLVCNAQPGDKQRGRPIEFSVPRSDEVTTNLHQSLSQPDGLKRLEEDLYKPPQLFEPQSSLDGVVALPTRPTPSPVIQNKRVKELLERRKNWIFMSPEDLLAAPTVDEILKTPTLGPDGQEQKDLPAFERYYKRLTTGKSEANDPLQSKNDELFGALLPLNPRKDVGVHEDSNLSSSLRDPDLPSTLRDPNLPSSLRETAEALNKVIEPGGSDSALFQGPTHGSLSDTFGLGNNTLSKEQIQEHKKLMDDYHSLWDPTWRPPTVATPDNPLAALADMASPAGNPVANQPGLPSAAPLRGLDLQANVLNPTLGPAALPDVNAQALGQTKPIMALPQIDSTRVTPVAPSFDAPRRSFR